MTWLDPFGWGARRKARQQAQAARDMREEVKAEWKRTHWTCPHGHTIEYGQYGPDGCKAGPVPRLSTIWR